MLQQFFIGHVYWCFLYSLGAKQIKFKKITFFLKLVIIAYNIKIIRSVILQGYDTKNMEYNLKNIIENCVRNSTNDLNITQNEN